MASETKDFFAQAKWDILRRISKEDQQREWNEERDAENHTEFRTLETQAERDARRALESARQRARRLAVRLEKNRRIRQVRAENVPATHQLALSPIESANSVPPHNCGPMDHACTHCNAKHFLAERPSRCQFNIYCQKVRVTLVSLGEGFTCPHFARLRSLMSVRVLPAKSQSLNTSWRKFGSTMVWRLQLKTENSKVSHPKANKLTLSMPKFTTAFLRFIPNN